MIYLWIGLLFIVWFVPALVNYQLLKAVILQEATPWTNATRLIVMLLSAYSIPVLVLLLIGAVFPFQWFEEWLVKPAKW